MATAQDVIDRVRNLINDEVSQFVSGVRWTDEEMLRWITDGQREIVQLKPEANPVTEVFDVEGGLPRQRLDPNRAYRLIRVEANGVGIAEPEPEPGHPEFVFEVGLVEEGVLGYSSDFSAGTLLSNTTGFNVLSLFHLSFGSTLWLELQGTDSTPPEDAFSVMQIFLGEDFDVENLIVELERDTSEDRGDNIRRWSWSSSISGDPFSGLDGLVVGVRFIP